MAPKIMPNQKWRKLLAWRLKNGVTNIDDIELELGASACERIVIFFGGLVVFWLLIEVLVASIHPSYGSFLERWGAVVADTFVAVGVAIEVFASALGSKCQSELQRRSNLKLSEAIEEAAKANKKAAEANLARAHLENRLAPRRVNAAAQLRMRASLSAFAGARVFVRNVNSNTESKTFAHDFTAALSVAGLNASLEPGEYQYSSSNPTPSILLIGLRTIEPLLSALAEILVKEGLALKPVLANIKQQGDDLALRIEIAPKEYP